MADKQGLILIASPLAERRRRWSRALLGAYVTLEVAGREALEYSLKSLKPAVLLLDLSSDRFVNPESLPALKRLSPSTKIVVLRNFSQRKDEIAVLEMGVRGYCHVNSPPNVLLKAVKHVIQGEYWIERRVMSKLLDELVSMVESNGQSRGQTGPIANSAKFFNSLTDRECEVVRFVGVGQSNKEIASALTISEKTVKAHLTAVFRKLNVPDRLRLALLVNVRP